MLFLWSIDVFLVTYPLTYYYEEFKSKLFHKIEEGSEVCAQMREEVEMGVLRNLPIHPNNPLGPQLPDIMLKLILGPMLFLRQQFSRNKSILRSNLQQNSQIIVKFNRHCTNIGVVNN